MFYRRSRFELVHKVDIPMKNVFASLLVGDARSLSLHAQFLPLLHASPHLVQALQRVSRHPLYRQIQSFESVHICSFFMGFHHAYLCLKWLQMWAFPSGYIMRSLDEPL